MFNWGIIGPGRIAHKFAKSIGEIENARIYAVASHNIDKANAFAKEYKVEKVFSSYDDIAKCKDLDAIYIATTNPHHHEPAILCLNNNIPVLCEKPLTLNSELASKMITAAKSNNTFLMEAMWTRFMPPIVELRKWISDGLIGEVKMLKADFCINANPDPTDRWLNPQLGGGALLDLGIYPLLFTTMILGTDYESISSTRHLAETGVDENCAILLKYAQGRIAQISCSLFSQGPNRAVILGAKGYIEVDNFVFANQAKLVIDDEVTYSNYFDKLDTGFKYEAQEAMDCINNGETQSTIMPWSESLEVMKIIDKVKASIGLKYPLE